jgi:hypothetical protein
VYRQPEKPTIQDVIEAWKIVTAKVEELMGVIGTHHQLCIALYNARMKEKMQSVQLQLSVWERILFSLGQNKAEYEDRMAEENLLRLLVKTCNNKADDGESDVHKSFREMAESVREAHSVTKMWAQPILDRFRSEITTSAITATDMVSLLRSLEKIFGKTNEAKSLLQKAQEFWTQSAQNHLLFAMDTSTDEYTSAHSTMDATINTIKDMLPLLLACEKIYEKSTCANRYFYWMMKEADRMFWLLKTPITDPNSKPNYWITEVYVGQIRYSLTQDSIQPCITEVITAAEEAVKLFPSSPDKPDTQTA